MERIKNSLQNHLVAKDLLEEFYDLHVSRVIIKREEYDVLNLDAKISIKIYNFDEYFEIFIHIPEHYSVLERNILHLRLHKFITKNTIEITSNVTSNKSYYHIEIEKDEKSYMKLNWLFKVLSKYL